MAITASMVKQLRERTGAGMMECKKALVETNGDIEASIEMMRKRGQAKAAKRAAHTASEGIITIANSKDTKKACMIEVNCETDFVARDDGFRDFAAFLAQRSLETGAESVEQLLTMPVDDRGGQTLEEKRTELIAKIGENIQLRRMALFRSEGVVGIYLHGDRIGVMVSLDKNIPETAKDIAMHIAAMSPQAIDADRVPPDLVNKEQEIFLAQAKQTGKPDNIIEKMVEGRIAKFIKEVCLLEQPFVKDPNETVGGLLKSDQANVLDFARFEVGEGVEKETVDFAQEVQAQIKGQE